MSLIISRCTKKEQLFFISRLMTCRNLLCHIGACSWDQNKHVDYSNIWEFNSFTTNVVGNQYRNQLNKVVICNFPRYCFMLLNTVGWNRNEPKFPGIDFIFLFTFVCPVIFCLNISLVTRISNIFVNFDHKGYWGLL